METPTLSTVKQFAEKNPAFPESGLRHLIFYADINGLQASGALLRTGRKILIDDEKFFDWIKSNNSKIKGETK